MNERTGMIQIYTGDGKGKTTAAVGQAIRAAAAGLKVLFVFFNKIRSENSGEDKLLEKLGISTRFFASYHPSFFPETSSEKMKKDTFEGLQYISNELSGKKYDIIIMDEILVSVRDEFITEDELVELLQKKPIETELILTGRGATKCIKENADLISEILDVKHPFRNGQKWRRGIEK